MLTIPVYLIVAIINSMLDIRNQIGHLDLCCDCGFSNDSIVVLFYQ